MISCRFGSLREDQAAKAAAFSHEPLHELCKKIGKVCPCLL